MAVQNSSAASREIQWDIWRGEAPGREVRRREPERRESVRREPVRREPVNREPVTKRNPYLAEGIQSSRRRSERSRAYSGIPVQQERGRAYNSISTQQRRSNRENLAREFAAVDREAVSRRNAARRRAQMRRRRRILIQRLALGIWAACLLVLALSLAIRDHQSSAAGNGKQPEGSLPVSAGADGGQGTNYSNEKIQGLPAEVYAKHPDWTENFLTPNEYSRPGDPLESVTNIFVHYTANPGTSAAQNRSYFEQQKDTHEASVSSHFIIGYEGEILQCVPLDEIAYAVQTRNFDSISIECCYIAENGAFTEETYDSLISLLAWLVDAYDLETEDILRHYDCGGKKCPLYYTEHEDEWEQLKKDVDKL